jgi:hypothetical protein
VELIQQKLAGKWAAKLTFDKKINNQSSNRCKNKISSWSDKRIYQVNFCGKVQENTTRPWQQTMKPW